MLFEEFCIRCDLKNVSVFALHFKNWACKGSAIVQDWVKNFPSVRIQKYSLREEYQGLEDYYVVNLNDLKEFYKNPPDRMRIYEGFETFNDEIIVQFKGYDGIWLDVFQIGYDFSSIDNVIHSVGDYRLMTLKDKLDLLNSELDQFKLLKKVKKC